MIVFIANTSINNMNGSNKGKADTVDCTTTYIAIQHFIKREEREMLLKILSIKSFEWCPIHRYHKVLL